MDKNALLIAIKEKVILSSVVSASVKLRGQSPSFTGLCPFHQEKTPSFHVRDNVARFKCFGCGASGDVFEFVMRLRGISFKEAVNELASNAGIDTYRREKQPKPVKNVDALKAIRAAQVYFQSTLFSGNGKEALAYLIKHRGLNEKMIKQAGLGFAGFSSTNFFEHLQKQGIDVVAATEAGLIKQGREKKISQFLSRITFPIRNFDGETIAFAGRTFLDKDADAPKYLNTHSYRHYEKRKIFYGVFESKAAMLKGIAPVIVEGYFDAMAMWALGAPALALCGTAFSDEHAKFLSRSTSRVLLCFDSDNAGLLALKHSLVILFNHGFTAQLIVVDKKDPGDYLATHSLDELSSIIKKPLDALCFLIEQISINAQQSIDERMRHIDSMLAIFAAIKRPLIRRQYVAYLAKHLHDDPAILWAEISQRIKKTSKKEIKTLPPKLEASEGLLLQIALSQPLLVDDFDELLLSVSETMKSILKAIHSLFVEKSVVNADDLKEIVLPIASEKWPAIAEIYKNGIRLSRDEAKAFLVGFKDKLAENRLKDCLLKKRLEAQHFEKSGDFPSMLNSLKEKRDLLSLKRAKLAKSKKDLVIINKPETPAKVAPKKKNREIKALSKESNFFDPAEDFY